MALNAGDIVRFSVQGTWFSQLILNVFHYRIVDAPTVGLDIMAGEFWTYVKTEWRNLFSVGEVYFQSIMTEQLGGDREYFEFVIPIGERTGTRSVASAYLPPFIAASVKLVPINRQVRPGAKRFVGACEADLNGAFWEASYLAVVQSLADRLDDTIPVVLGVDSLQPVIHGEAHDAYISPDTGEPVDALPERNIAIASVLVNNRVTTQNTRKIGYGS